VSEQKSNREVIISSASGCGVMVKDYGSLFDKDDVYYQKAQTVSQNTCDIAQFLADKDLSIFKTLNQTITYHSPSTAPQHCFCGVSSTLYPNLVKIFLTL
jgi:glycolate oxidase iron-sulfur subunit